MRSAHDLLAAAPGLGENEGGPNARHVTGKARLAGGGGDRLAIRGPALRQVRHLLTPVRVCRDGHVLLLRGLDVHQGSTPRRIRSARASYLHNTLLPSSLGLILLHPWIVPVAWHGSGWQVWGAGMYFGIIAEETLHACVQHRSKLRHPWSCVRIHVPTCR